jgi:hypothetical protein
MAAVSISIFIDSSPFRIHPRRAGFTPHNRLRDGYPSGNPQRSSVIP